MAGRKNSTFAVTKVRLGDGLQVDTRADTVAGEEPLEIRVGGQTITTTMRTPGHDVELAHGFLHSEGHIASLGDDMGIHRHPGNPVAGLFGQGLDRRGATYAAGGSGGGQAQIAEVEHILFC